MSIVKTIGIKIIVSLIVSGKLRKPVVTEFNILFIYRGPFYINNEFIRVSSFLSCPMGSLVYDICSAIQRTPRHYNVF